MQVAVAALAVTLSPVQHRAVTSWLRKWGWGRSALQLGNFCTEACSACLNLLLSVPQVSSCSSLELLKYFTFSSLCGTLSHSQSRGWELNRSMAACAIKLTSFLHLCILEKACKIWDFLVKCFIWIYFPFLELISQNRGQWYHNVKAVALSTCARPFCCFKGLMSCLEVRKGKL